MRSISKGFIVMVRSRARVITASLACAFMLGVLAFPNSPWPYAGLMVALMTFSYVTNRGMVLVPAALVGVFVPLRKLSSIVSNDILAGPLDTASFPVETETRLLTAAATFLIVVVANLRALTPAHVEKLKQAPLLPSSARWLFGLLLVVSSATYMLRAGGAPLLMDDAEAVRVSIQSGAAYLLYLGYVPAAALAIDLGYRTGRRELSMPVGLICIFLIVSLLFLPGSRLPGVIVLFAFVLSHMHSSATAGRRSIRPLIVAGAGAAVLVAAIGAMRASYVGVQKGLLLGPFEHLFRRSAADIGNADIIVARADSIAASTILTQPFIVYLPGGQPNLGLLLKEQFGMSFDGGGITVPLVSEGYVLGGAPGVLIVAFAVGLLALMATRVIMSLSTSNRVATFLAFQLSTLAFMNVGNAGLVEMIATTFVPFFTIGLIVMISSFELDRWASRRQVSR